MSSETIDCHYFGHHKGYIDKTNELLNELGLAGCSLEKIILNHEGKLFDNAAQAWNHTFFWLGLKPEIEPPKPGGPLMRAIESAFGGLEPMKEQFLDAATNLFGSGWTWLVANDLGDLDFINTQNADNPIRLEKSHPLWTCDVWEHAYYIDYRNERKEFLEGIWSHINWEFAEQNYHFRRIPNMSRLMQGESAEENHSSAWM
jgi:superoxide dismutase, Fe-Mn family